MISTQEWIYLIRGASAIDRQRPEKPNVFWLSEEVNFNCYLIHLNKRLMPNKIIRVSEICM